MLYKCLNSPLRVRKWTGKRIAKDRNREKQTPLFFLLKIKGFQWSEIKTREITVYFNLEGKDEMSYDQ